MHHGGAQNVAGLHFIRGIGGKSFFKLDVVHPEQISATASPHFLEEAPEITKRLFGFIREDEGAAVEVFMEIGNQQNAIENSDIISFLVAVAVTTSTLILSIDLRELEMSFTVGAVDEIFSVVAIRAGCKEFGIYKGGR